MTSFYPKQTRLTETKQSAADSQQANNRKAAEADRTFTVEVNDEGAVFIPTETTTVEVISKETVSDAPKQSPFSLDEIEKFRNYPVVKQQFEQQRSKDLLAHHKFMKTHGPEIEKAVGTSAKKVFLQGDSKAAAKLQRENPQAYRWLKEYSRYL